MLRNLFHPHCDSLGSVPLTPRWQIQIHERKGTQLCRRQLEAQGTPTPGEVESRFQRTRGETDANPQDQDSPRAGQCQVAYPEGRLWGPSVPGWEQVWGSGKCQ